VVVGAQWGDEGKGKIVDVLAERADLVVRYQGGANAGHTVAGGVRECVTLMRGCWGTARVVHTPGDTAARLTLEGVAAVAQAVAGVLRSARRNADS